MAERTERRNGNPNRKTYSAYLDNGVVAALDLLVSIGEYPNRSEAIEEACRRLVREDAGTPTLAQRDRIAS